MIVRQAIDQDAFDICDIHNDVIRNTDATFTTQTRSPDDVLAQIHERGPAFLVAEKSILSGVIGFATYGRFRDGPGYAATKELTIMLAPSIRGVGLGKKLMAHLEASAPADGLHVLIAGISGSNSDAIAFHRKLGFLETARMPEVGRKFDRWLDLILMQKTLTPPR